ncbi:MAG: hypothetical protein M3349_05440 [Actinomycetota bacterium]|nr:hypothetical protein [Actinomycetota bacterium]
MIRPARVRLWDVTISMHHGLRTATGSIHQRRSIILAATGGGHTGWGEAAPVGGHTLDTADDAWTLLVAEAGRIVAGGEPVPIEGSTATAAIDTALTDLAARADGSSLAAHLGGDMDPVPASVVIDLPRSPQELVDDVARAVTAGYRHVKIKIDPATVHLVAAARHAHPSLGIAVDANGSFDATGIDRLIALDGLGLDYIEQPLAGDDIGTLTALHDALATPICLDESIRRLADITAAAGFADAVALKPGRLGPSLTVQALGVAARNGLGVKIGGLVETGVGRNLLVAMATHPGVTLPSDLAASDRYFKEDLVTPPWRIAGGHLIPRRTLVVDEEALQRFTTQHHDTG